MNSSFYLSIPPESVEYGFSTPAGSVKFDNRAARHIVKELAERPRRLADLAAAGDFPAGCPRKRRGSHCGVNALAR